MTQFEKHIPHATKQVRLSEAEHARMRNVLESYMRFYPLPQPVTTYTRTVSWIIYLQRPIAAALVLVLVSSTGITYAAESALPGDALYSVKTKVTEPVKVALAQGAESKAEVQLALAERRVAEAAALVAGGRLDAEHEEELATALENHTTAAATLVSEIEEEDAATALDIAVSFETRLHAREEVLAQVRTSEDTTDKHRFNEVVRDAATKVAEIRVRSEAKLAVATPTEPMAFAAAVSKMSTTDVIEEEETPPAATMAMRAMPVAEVPEVNASASALVEADAIAPTPEVVEAQVKSVPSDDVRAANKLKASAERAIKRAEKKVRGDEGAKDQLRRAYELITAGGASLESGDASAARTAFRTALDIAAHVSIFNESKSLFARADTNSESDAPGKKGENSQAKNDDTKNIKAPEATTFISSPKQETSGATTTKSESSSSGSGKGSGDDQKSEESNHGENDESEDEERSSNSGSGKIDSAFNLNITL